MFRSYSLTLVVANPLIGWNQVSVAFRKPTTQKAYNLETQFLIPRATPCIMLLSNTIYQNLNKLDTSAYGIYSLQNTSDTYKTLRLCLRDFISTIFSILNPVDPLASVSNLYIVVHKYMQLAYQMQSLIQSVD